MLYLLSVALEHVAGSGLGDEEDGLECDLSLRGEVGVSHGLVLVLGEGLVELCVLVLLDLGSSVGGGGEC